MLKRLYFSLHAFWSTLSGRNTKNTPVDVIKSQLHESRALPIGVPEFEEWSTRILSGCCFPAERESQIWALAVMLLQLGPHEDFVPDAHFIKGLRAAAVKQTADNVAQEIKRARAEQEKAKRIAADQVAKEAVANAPRLEAVKSDGLLAK